MQILFLDIDDVLVVPTLYKIKSRRRVRDGRKVHYAFLPTAKTCLLSILSACPGAAIVISSTWRLEGRREVDAILRLNGCGRLIERLHDDWRTCDPACGVSRAEEIAEWLARHPETTRSAAIDNDSSIIGRIWGVAVDPVTGLTEREAIDAIELLSVPGAAIGAGADI